MLGRILIKGKVLVAGKVLDVLHCQLCRVHRVQGIQDIQRNPDIAVAAVGNCVGLLCRQREAQVFFGSPDLHRFNFLGADRVKLKDLAAGTDGRLDCHDWVFGCRPD